jgi:RNA polymerase sigma-70 factor (ECF subfamily)
MAPTAHPAASSRPVAGEQTASDQALLAGLARGDVGAGGLFVDRYQRRVYGLARSIVGDSTKAEDIAQEALSRAWRHADTYDARRGSVATWVLAMTRNIAIDSLRRRAAEPVDQQSVMFLHLLEPGPGPEEAASIAEEVGVLRSALAELPVGQRRALVMAAFYGYTAREVSEAETIPLGTAKTRIRIGLRKLRARLRPEEILVRVIAGAPRQK